MKHWVFILLIALALPLRAQTNAAAAMQKIGDMYMEGRNTPKARLADSVVTLQDLILIAAKMVPLSRTMKEQINAIRGWAFERAVRASAPAVRR